MAKLDHWRVMLPLQKILNQDSKIDKRTTSGMQKSYSRCMECNDEDIKLQGVMVKRYHTQCEFLMNHPSSALRHASDSEMETFLKIVLDEGLLLPAPQQRALVSRKTALAMANGNVKAVLQICSPFAMETVFDPKNPLLASVQDAQKDKLATFVQILSKDLLSPLIQGGAESRQSLLALCQTSENKFQDVDVVELDGPTSQLLTLCRSLWSALKAVLDVSSFALEAAEIGHVMSPNPH